MAIQNEHLISFQILKKVKNIFIILLLCTIPEDLKLKGVLKSYLKQDKNYHFAALIFHLNLFKANKRFLAERISKSRFFYGLYLKITIHLYKLAFRTVI
jgi:hypothetical protein